jgi:hypothetical protein
VRRAGESIGERQKRTRDEEGIMYRTIYIDYEGRFVTGERERAARIAHLRAAGERCPRKGILRRCAPVVTPLQAAR